MNKITPHQLRDLDSTLPPGTECYLSSTARKALNQYRKGKYPAASVSKEEARTLLIKRLGRGLKRFLVADMRSLLPSTTYYRPEKAA
ncbi:MAG: hypothetical protein ACU836_07345 [Gammaproteobacteria bacterium]